MSLYQSPIQRAIEISFRSEQSISGELYEALKDYGINKITALLKEIYDTTHIPPDLFKSIFTSLP